MINVRIVCVNNSHSKLSSFGFYLSKYYRDLAEAKRVQKLVK